MEIIKFEDIDDFLLSVEFMIKDLSYCDLSGIDLGELPASTWNDFIFDHTNFTDTNIKFYPSLLKQIPSFPFRIIQLEYCNFTNCDLSYLETSEFLRVSIKGSNFTNTNLDVEFTNVYGVNIYMDPENFKSYADVTFPLNEKMFNNIIKADLLINYQTLKNNPMIPFSSYNIYCSIRNKLDEFERKMSVGKLNKYINQMLEEDIKREGKLAQFFNILNSSSNFTDEQRIKFFTGVVEYKKFKEVDLSCIPIQLIKEIEFIECTFDKVIFPKNYEKEYGNFGFYKCFVPKVCFPTITPSSWDKFSEKRFGSSRITFHRNLYLELGRICNGKCRFCRNQFLEPCRYDFKKIKENLSSIRYKIDNIVIGGGEPTLLLDDIIKLKNNIFRSDSIIKNINWTIFTNGSLSLDKLIQLENEFNLNISRHSVDDDVNNKILGVSSLTTRELGILRRTNYPNITLCATCFRGEGIDSIDKMVDYIKLSDYCQIQNVLFQTLHKDLNDSDDAMPVLPIEDEIFDEMIIKLEEQGYSIGIPIYSTGDYKLVIAKKDGKTISFKKYITKEELEKEWYQACKRTFDLSMDPGGNIYQNWHQSSDKVLLKNK